jgi:hypothetical protein
MFTYPSSAYNGSWIAPKVAQPTPMEGARRWKPSADSDVRERVLLSLPRERQYCMLGDSMTRIAVVILFYAMQKIPLPFGVR